MPKAKKKQHRINLKTNTSKSVSYTHLDVYKRQPSWSVLGGLRLSSYHSHGRSFISPDPRITLNYHPSSSHTSVSYTHLHPLHPRRERLPYPQLAGTVGFQCRRHARYPRRTPVVSRREPLGIETPKRHIVAAHFLPLAGPVSYTHLDVYKRQPLYQHRPRYAQSLRTRRMLCYRRRSGNGFGFRTLRTFHRNPDDPCQ